VTVTVGQRLVLRRLNSLGGHGKGPRPPALGLVVTEPGADGRFSVRLSMGFGQRGRWAPRARVVELANVDREATPREVALGMVL
jgi:hypothetical protein